MIKRRYLLVFVTVLIVLDQAFKIWIKTNMTLNQAFMVFGNWFQIRFIENPGAAFGFELGGEHGKIILSLFRIAAVIVLGIYIDKLIKRDAPKGVIVGFSLILAGALGNIIDSAFYGIIFSESTMYSVAEIFPADGGYGTFLHGHVVDMLYFPIIDSTFPSWLPFWGGQSFIFFSPIFNMADSYVSIGIIYLLIFQRKFFS